MIDFIPILKMKDNVESRHGCVALDHNGGVAIYADKNLTEALSALFRLSTTLLRTSRREGQMEKQEVLTNDRGSWLTEMRRQMPSPYYGGSIGSATHSLDQIPQLYQALNDETTETYEFKRILT